MSTIRKMLPFALCLLLAACGDAAPTQSGSTPEAHGPAADGPEDAPGGALPIFATWRGEGTTLEFSTDGMDCSGCSSNLKKRLEAIDGVEAAETDHESGIGLVTLADESKREALLPAITDAVENPEAGKKFTLLRAP